MGLRCTTHKVDLCRCGITFEDHYQEYLDMCSDEVVAQNIKDECVMCKYPLERSNSRYIEKGNYCNHCDRIYNTYNNSYWVEFDDMMAMLLSRREYVQNMQSEELNPRPVPEVRSDLPEEEPGPDTLLHEELYEDQEEE